MQAFCTIISPDFVPFARCLHESLKRFQPEIDLHVLVVSEEPQGGNGEHVHFYALPDITSPMAEGINHKYAGSTDNHRWSLKPVFMLHLLGKVEKLIYVDCDLFFFADYSFLFDALETQSVLLTPHFASTDPFLSEEKFMMNYLIGLYNAGFVGVSRAGIRALEWWATSCYYHMENAPAKGYFVDQRYLDMLPVIDEGASLVRHQGCNVGSWNTETFRRVVQPDGTVLINGRYPVVFIHFNHETIQQILNGNDRALRVYFDQYEQAFARTGFRLDGFIKSLNDWKKEGLFLRIKRRLSLRSRMKRLLFNWAKSI